MSKLQRYWSKQIRKALRKMKNKKTTIAERKAVRLNINNYTKELVKELDRKAKARGKK
jgi:hypothetical protein